MLETTLDPARNLRLYFRCARDGSKTFFFLDPNGDPKDMTDYEFVWQLKQRPQYPGNILELTNSDIPRPSTNSILIKLTPVTSNVPPNDYYWQLNVTLPSGEVKTWLTGIATAHNGEFDGLTKDCDTITISASALTVVGFTPQPAIPNADSSDDTDIINQILAALRSGGFLAS